MKNLKNNVSKALLTAILVAGVGVVSSVSAASADDRATDKLNQTQSIMLASSVSHKAGPSNGRPPYYRHIAHDQRVGDAKPAGHNISTSNRKPPYNKHIAHDEDLEKVQFSRFEEKAAAVDSVDRAANRKVRRMYPPYTKHHLKSVID